MRVALITGGTRGIGRALVETFAAADYAVAFTYASSSDAASEIESAQKAEGRTVRGYQAAVEDPAACEKVFAEVEQDIGPVDVLINNAGITRDGPLHRMSPDDWHQVIATNLTGTFYYSQKAVQSMLRGGGVILNVTSVSALIGMPGQGKLQRVQGRHDRVYAFPRQRSGTIRYPGERDCAGFHRDGHDGSAARSRPQESVRPSPDEEAGRPGGCCETCPLSRRPRRRLCHRPSLPD